MFRSVLGTSRRAARALHSTAAARSAVSRTPETAELVATKERIAITGEVAVIAAGGLAIYVMYDGYLAGLERIEMAKEAEKKRQEERALRKKELLAKAGIVQA
eukprot:tig00000842_g4856.t1